MEKAELIAILHMVWHAVRLQGTEYILIFQFSKYLFLWHGESVIKLFLFGFEFLLGVVAIIILFIFNRPLSLLRHSFLLSLSFFQFLLYFLILWEIAWSVIQGNNDGCILSCSFYVLLYSNDPFYLCSYFADALRGSFNESFVN